MDTTPVRPLELSFAERDRRWTNVRALMRAHKLDDLIVAGFVRDQVTKWAKVVKDAGIKLQ